MAGRRPYSGPGWNSCAAASPRCRKDGRTRVAVAAGSQDTRHVRQAAVRDVDHPPRRCRRFPKSKPQVRYRGAMGGGNSNERGGRFECNSTISQIIPGPWHLTHGGLPRRGVRVIHHCKQMDGCHGWACAVAIGSHRGSSARPCAMLARRRPSAPTAGLGRNPRRGQAGPRRPKSAA